MTTVLLHNPGQIVTLVLEVLNFNSERADAYSAPPIVQRIVMPDLTVAAGYPQNMSRYDTGLYYFKFKLPSGAVGLGTFIADVTWLDPDFQAPRQNAFQIIVSAPFGNYSASVR